MYMHVRTHLHSLYLSCSSKLARRLICNRYVLLLGVHEMHGRIHP